MMRGQSSDSEGRAHGRHLDGKGAAAAKGSAEIPGASVRGRRADDVDKVPFSQRLSCTVAEACIATGLGRTKLYELIGARLLDTTTVGRRRLVCVPSLLSLIGAKEN